MLFTNGTIREANHADFPGIIHLDRIAIERTGTTILDIKYLKAAEKDERIVVYVLESYGAIASFCIVQVVKVNESAFLCVQKRASHFPGADLLVLNGVAANTELRATKLLLLSRIPGFASYSRCLNLEEKKSRAAAVWYARQTATLIGGQISPQFPQVTKNFPPLAYPDPALEPLLRMGFELITHDPGLVLDPASFNHAFFLAFNLPSSQTIYIP